MKKNNEPIVNRGDIYYSNLSPSQGSEQGGLRPTLIVQNDVGNKYAPTTIVVPITSRLSKKQLPTHVILAKGCGLSCESVALCEQIRTIDKSRLSTKLGAISKEEMVQIDKALKVSLAMD
jgi:mRNA interferase MazF